MTGPGSKDHNVWRLMILLQGGVKGGVQIRFQHKRSLGPEPQGWQDAYRAGWEEIQCERKDMSKVSR